MGVKVWIRRVKTINTYLPALEDGQKTLTEDQLIKIIAKNIPKEQKTDFLFTNGKNCTTTLAAQKQLDLLKKREKKKDKVDDRNERRKDTDKKKNGGARTQDRGNNNT